MHRLLLAAALLLAAPAGAQVLRDDLWVTNGAVNAMAIQGNTLYIGGSFTRVGPATGGMVALDGTTAATLTAPMNVDGQINAILPDGMGGWYLGGTFQHVKGVARASLARVNKNGALLPWNPGVNGIVKTMVQVGNAIYIGGSFVTAGGQNRANLAAIDTATAQATGWNPGTNGVVNAIVRMNGLFYVGGDFSSIAGVGRTDLAALDDAGTANGFSPGSDGTVYALAVHYNAISLVTQVFVGGAFGNCGGQPRANLAVIDATPGSLTFGQANTVDLAPNGAVNTLQVVGNTIYTLYVGGNFQFIGGQPRNYIATTRGSTVLSWNPGTNGSVTKIAFYYSNVLVGGLFTQLAGQSRLNAGMVNSSTGVATPWNPQPNSVPRAFGVVDTTVCMGGDFSSIGGVARSNLAALDLTSGMATSWNAGTNGTVWGLESIGNLLYAVGEFNHITDVPLGYGGVIDANGNVGSWDPQANDFIYAIASRNVGNKNILYLGGRFTSVKGSVRNRLAAIDDLLPISSLEDWDPSAGDGEVDALVADGNAIYAAGTFTTINGGQPIPRLARIRGNGVATGWNANPGLRVLSLGLQNGMVFAGFSGQTTIGGSTRRGAAALDTVTAQAKIWTPEPIGSIFSFLPSGTTAMYLGGNFQGSGTANFSNLMQVDVLPSGVGDANMSFDPEPWNWMPVGINAQKPGVYVLRAAGGKLYAGGKFTSILGKPHSNIAGMFTTTVGVEAPVAQGVSLRAQPNPASGTQVLTFTLAQKGPARVELYSVAGRLVRTLGGDFEAGTNTMHWDGRDMAGTAVAPGLYFARLRGETTKLLRIQ